eukprot:TRINITY_DN4082_c0_g1_i5.p1 TRINITY_DN4082_c0_g1~~TRINITY_DN4082_c0_g1_i5.p1  ORF type:complete len:1413 (+),score=259.10 TRINITY_DN4082_c0_g1_i5:149-4387(+)
MPGESAGQEASTQQQQGTVADVSSDQEPNTQQQDKQQEQQAPDKPEKSTDPEPNPQQQQQQQEQKTGESSVKETDKQKQEQQQKTKIVKLNIALNKCDNLSKATNITLVVSQEGQEDIKTNMKIQSYISAIIQVRLPAVISISYQVTEAGQVRATPKRELSISQSTRYFIDCVTFEAAPFIGVAGYLSTHSRISRFKWSRTTAKKFVGQIKDSLSSEKEGVVEPDALYSGLVQSELPYDVVADILSEDAVRCPTAIQLLGRRTAHMVVGEKPVESQHQLHCTMLYAAELQNVRKFDNVHRLKYHLRIPKQTRDGFFSLKAFHDMLLISYTKKDVYLIPIMVLMAPEELYAFEESFTKIWFDVQTTLYALSFTKVTSPLVFRVVAQLTELMRTPDYANLNDHSVVNIITKIASMLANSVHLETAEDAVLAISVIQMSRKSEVESLQRKVLERFVIGRMRIIHGCWQRNLSIAGMTPPLDLLIDCLRQDSLEDWVNDLDFIDKLVSESPSFLTEALKDPSLHRYLSRALLRTFSTVASKYNACTLNKAVLIFKELSAIYADCDDKNEEVKDLAKSENPKEDSNAKKEDDSSKKEDNEGLKDDSPKQDESEVPTSNGKESPPEVKEADPKKKPPPTKEDILPTEIVNKISNVLKELFGKLTKRGNEIISGTRTITIPELAELEEEKKLCANFNEPYCWEKFEFAVREWHALRKKIEDIRSQYIAMQKVVELPKETSSKISSHIEVSFKATRDPRSQLPTNEMQKIFEGFWEYSKWKFLLAGMPQLHKISEKKDGRIKKLFPYLSSKAKKDAKKLDRLERLTNTLTSVRDNLLEVDPGDKIIPENDWLHRDLLELVVTVVGGKREYIPTLLKHAQNLTYAEHINDWLILNNYQQKSLEGLKKETVSKVEKDITFYVSHGFDPALAKIYSTKRQLKPVINMLKRNFSDSKAFVNFMTIALDYTTQTPELQRVLRELNKAHLYRESADFGKLPEVKLSLFDKISEIQELIDDLKDSGGREMRKLAAVVSDSVVVISTEPESKLVLTIDDVLTLEVKAIGTMRCSEWEEFMNAIEFGFPNLEGKHLENMKSANKLLAAAKNAATAFINTRKAGAPNVAGAPNTCGKQKHEHFVPSFLKTNQDCWERQLKDWNKRFLNMQVQHPVIINLPMAVLKSVNTSWSPLRTSTYLSGGAPEEFLFRGTRQNIKKGIFQTSVEGVKCPYATIYKVLGNVLPEKIQRWSVLLGHRTTTVEDVNLFISRVKCVPSTAYGCTNISQMAYPLQKRLLNEIEELQSSATIFIADGVERPESFVKKETISIKETTQPLPNRLVVVGSPGSGKTVHVKKILQPNKTDRAPRRRVVTINGDMTEISYSALYYSPEYLIIRVGDSVLDMSDVDRLLFQILFLDCVVDEEFKVSEP